MPDLLVTSHILNSLSAAARRAAPNEACGLLLGRGGRIEEVRETANVARDPRRRFEIDPAALIAAHRDERAGGMALIGYFHSHPAGAAEPSATDRAEAAGDGRVWAIIGADGTIGWFVNGPDGFSAFHPQHRA